MNPTKRDGSKSWGPDTGSEEPPVDLPRYERFRPHSANGLTRGWIVAIAAFLLAEDALLEASVLGFGLALSMTIATAAIAWLGWHVDEWIARKLDPFKGTAPGDRVQPIELPPKLPRFGEETSRPKGPDFWHDPWSDHFHGPTWSDHVPGSR
ncbi:MAG: hypothetical protein ABSG36_00500 [Acidimicrobiales bacterium]|jgi:hypothetical protein